MRFSKAEHRQDKYGMQTTIRILTRLSFLLAIWILFVPENGFAATVTPSSCSQTDVADAINRAGEGDTVVVPACTVTWTASIAFCKSLTVQGAGAGRTNIAINTNVGTPGGFLSIGSGCSSKTVRVTGFSLINQLIPSLGMISFFQCFGCTARIDHNTFLGNVNPGEARTVYIGGSTTGVMDHNTVTDMGFIIDYTVKGEGNGTLGNYSWTQPPSFGTANAFYVEDNTFTFPDHSSDVDCQNGGRAVWRYNTFVGPNRKYNATSNTGPFDHGFDSVPRSCFELDVYNNTILGGGFNGVWFRGGSGLVYNNLFLGHWDGNEIAITNYRSDVGGYPPYSSKNQLACNESYAPHSCEPCDGSSVVDGNISFGWPCKDQIGRGQNQGSFPIYAWNNCLTELGCTPGGTTAALVEVIPAGLFNPDYTAKYHILANRDFYDAVAIFDGSAGVGQGTLAGRPATCTKGVAYWGTDTNVLYQCSATNTWSAYYTPFTYPHPLVGQPTVEPPPQLSVTVN